MAQDLAACPRRAPQLSEMETHGRESMNPGAHTSHEGTTSICQVSRLPRCLAPCRSHSRHRNITRSQ